MKLTTRARNRVKDSNFALPGRRYPIHDISHARNALARVSQFGTPEERAQVRAAVHRRFPGIGMESDATATRGNLMEMIKLKPLHGVRRDLRYGDDSGADLAYAVSSRRFARDSQRVREFKAIATSSAVPDDLRLPQWNHAHTPPTPTTVSKKRINEYLKKKMKANPSFYAPVFESISGGRSEGMRGKFPKGQMRMGRKVEHEHSPKNSIADEIARDHLSEFPDYYTRLRRMEAQAKKYWSKRRYKMHEYQERIRGVRESTNAAFANLVEVSDNLVYRAFKAAGDRIASRQNQALSPKQRQRKAMQAMRFGRVVTERMAKRTKELRDTWVRRGKYAAGGLALAGLGYGGYRYYKHRQAQKTQPTQESLREDGLDIRHLELGLKAAQAFGADKLLSRRVQQQKHRSSAWKYAKRGALAGYLAPAVVTGGFHALEMGRAAKVARAEGVTGVSNILKRAYDLHQGKYKAPTDLAKDAFIDMPFSGMGLKLIGGGALAGGLYGLMKTPDAPRMKLKKDRTLTALTKPKRKFKYIRKEGKRYIYPKDIKTRGRSK